MKKFDLPPIDNAKLQQMIQQNLKDPALRKSFEQQIKKSLDLKKSHAEKMQQIEKEISGIKLKEQKEEMLKGDTASALKTIGLIIAIALLAMFVGNVRKKKQKR